MPTVRGFQVHIARERQSCKFWVEPVALEFNKGFRRHELGTIRQLVSDNLPLILDAWEQHCG